jgi:hypothetical protein
LRFSTIAFAACTLAVVCGRGFADEASPSDGGTGTPPSADTPSDQAPGAGQTASGDLLAPSEGQGFSQTWAFRAGAIVLARGDDSTTPVAVSANGRTLTTVIDASELNSPLRGGIEIDAVHRLAAFDVEFRYFSVDSSSGATAVSPPSPPPDLPALGVAFVGAVGRYISFGSPVAVSEYSELRSFELNFRRELSPFLTVLAGYRHLDLNEHILGAFGVFIPAVPPDTFSVDGFNRMDGFQLGGEAVLLRPNEGAFRIEGGAKVGVFGDAASNYGSFDSLAATATGTHAVFMSEWSVAAVLQITPHLAARFGYEGLLLDGVALASQQVGVLNPFAHTGAVANTGTPIYQGLNANMEYAW